MTKSQPENRIIEEYSRRADDYDAFGNQESVWAEPTRRSMQMLRFRSWHRLVVDVGCGTGLALARLAATANNEQQLVAVEPAAQMRERARQRLKRYDNVRVVDGRFEQLPITSASVDYLYSILAFHWTTDVVRSIEEIHRVLKADAGMDLFFTGRKSGREFTRKTTPIFLKYLGPDLIRSAKMRQHLTAESTRELFREKFDDIRLKVSESLDVYYDDLAGHLNWLLCRAAGHFQSVPSAEREHCDREIKQAIAGLETDRGIPYTVHLIHVSIN